MQASNGGSPSQSQISNLLGHYQAGRYGDAERLAISVTEQFPTYEAAKKLRASMLGHYPLPSVCQTCQAKPVKREDANQLIASDAET